MKSVDLETRSGVLGCLAIDDVSIVLLRDSYRSLMNFMQVHTFVAFYDVHRLTAQPVCYLARMCQNVFWLISLLNVTEVPTFICKARLLKLVLSSAFIQSVYMCFIRHDS